MIRRRVTAAAVPVALAVALAACGGDDADAAAPPVAATPTPTPAPSPTPSPTATPATMRVAFSFASGADGFLGDYADYAQGQEEVIDFRTAVPAAPASLPGRPGFLLSSQNRSDDVFMFVARPVTGLAPGARYRVDTRVTFATDAPAGCVGIGGAPGEAVRVKAGASPVQPAKVLAADRAIRVNFDKGNQATDGADLKGIGDVTQPQPGGSCSDGAFQEKTLDSGGAGPVVAANAGGRLWIVIGTDSGFEGLTAIYLLDGSVTFTPV